MESLNSSLFSDFQALLRKDFETNVNIKVKCKISLQKKLVYGKSVASLESAKVFAVIAPLSHYMTVAIFFEDTLDYAYQLIPAFISPALNAAPANIGPRFRLTSKGEAREYYTNQVIYNNTIYIYAPKITVDKQEITNFFAAQGKQVYMRDLEYYNQQWEARRPDVFISHDSADKAAVAEPLYHALTAKGLKVWFDKYTLNLGDSLTEKINEGIAECRYGVLILSKAFLANERWAKRELNSFSVKDAIGDSHKLIPVWHGISEQDLAATGNYWLIDKLGGSTDDIEELAEAIMKVVAKT